MISTALRAISPMVGEEHSNTHIAPLRPPTLLAQGDRQEWDQRKKVIDLYDTLRPSLYAHLACLGLSSEESEDITQECFLRLLRHLLEERPEGNLRAWIFRVADRFAKASGRNLWHDTGKARAFLGTRAGGMLDLETLR